MAALRVKSFLIYTATVHKRITVDEIAVKDVKVTENSNPLYLISMLKSKISMSSLTPQIKFQC